LVFYYLAQGSEYPEGEAHFAAILTPTLEAGLGLEGPGRNPRPVRAYVSHTHTERTFSSVDLRDFESIPTFFSEEEMAELQAAIDERRSRRLALGERSPEQAGQPDCSPDGVEAAFYDVRTQHPA
jgi:hypothetical protein